MGLHLRWVLIRIDNHCLRVVLRNVNMWILVVSLGLWWHHVLVWLLLWHLILISLLLLLHWVLLLLLVRHLLGRLFKFSRKVEFTKLTLHFRFLDHTIIILAALGSSSLAMSIISGFNRIAPYQAITIFEWRQTTYKAAPRATVATLS